MAKTAFFKAILKLCIKLFIMTSSYPMKRLSFLQVAEDVDFCLRVHVLFFLKIYGLKRNYL